MNRYLAWCAESDLPAAVDRTQLATSKAIAAYRGARAVELAVAGRSYQAC